METAEQYAMSGGVPVARVTDNVYVARAQVKQAWRSGIFELTMERLCGCNMTFVDK